MMSISTPLVGGPRGAAEPPARPRTLPRRRMAGTNTTRYTVEVERDEAGYWIATVPGVPGAHTFAKRLDDVVPGRIDCRGRCRSLRWRPDARRSRGWSARRRPRRATVLAGGLVVAGAHARPRRQMPRGWEAGHAGADLDQDHPRGAVAHSRDPERYFSVRGDRGPRWVVSAGSSGRGDADDARPDDQAARGRHRRCWRVRRKHRVERKLQLRVRGPTTAGLRTACRRDVVLAPVRFRFLLAATRARSGRAGR